jgi:hypothetical protein
MEGSGNMRENTGNIVKPDFHPIPMVFNQDVKYRYVLVQKELNLQDLAGTQFILKLDIHKIESDLFELRLINDQEQLIFGCDPNHKQVIMKRGKEELIEPFEDMIRTLEMKVDQNVEIRLNGELISKVPLEVSSQKKIQLRTINGLVKINEITKVDM